MCCHAAPQGPKQPIGLPRLALEQHMSAYKAECDAQLEVQVAARVERIKEMELAAARQEAAARWVCWHGELRMLQGVSGSQRGPGACQHTQGPGTLTADAISSQVQASCWWFCGNMQQACWGRVVHNVSLLMLMHKPSSPMLC